MIQMPFFLKTGKRFDVPAMQTFCVRQNGECFIKCKSNSECQSFGTGVVDECLGQLQCRLYSQRTVEITDLTNDEKYTHYILVSYSALHFSIVLRYSDVEFDYLANLIGINIMPRLDDELLMRRTWLTSSAIDLDVDLNCTVPNYKYT